MGIKIDHTQYLSDVRMNLGEAADEIRQKGPFTDSEFYRTIVDAGFSASISLLICDLTLNGAFNSTQGSATWKFQARKLGGSTWVDLNAAVTDSWGGGNNTARRVVLDSAALGANANELPLEVRLIITTTVADVCIVRMGGTNFVPAVRVFGESL